MRFAAFLLLALPCTLQAQVTVLHMNDTYRIDAVENGASGGPGRVATLIDRLEAEGKTVLVLHAGDFVAPSLESQYWGGKPMIEALNFLHAKAPVLVVPGNHEFDSSRPTLLADAITASRFPWLASNLRLATGNAAADQRIQRDTILNIGGMRIGIFALTMIDALRQYALVDTQYEQEAERRIGALEKQGANVILGLTHLPLPTDRALARLRRKHPRFLWIAGGHEHDLVSDELTDSTALITKGDSNARRIWSVTIALDGKVPRITAEPIRIDATIAVDPTYSAQIEQHYRTELERIVPFFKQQIGATSVVLDGREETMRNGESNWGNYMTDVMRRAFPDFPADAAILNSGTIRIDDQVDGPIRWEHLQRTFGFPARVGLVWLRGSDVRSLVLEQSVSGGRGDGRFLQLSGLRFSFDRSKPEGARVQQVEVQRGTEWRPLDEQATYIVAVPDYIYGGGDGYRFRSRALLSVPPGPDLKLMVFDAVSNAFARGESIAPKVEGRIREITN